MQPMSFVMHSIILRKKPQVLLGSSSTEGRVTGTTMADNAELVLESHPILRGRSVSPSEQVEDSGPSLEQYYTSGGPRGEQSPISGESKGSGLRTS